jgi:hypothetical protein
MIPCALEQEALISVFIITVVLGKKRESLFHAGAQIGTLPFPALQVQQDISFRFTEVLCGLKGKLTP